MSMLYIVLPPQCTEYPRFCLARFHCVCLSMPACSVATCPWSQIDRRIIPQLQLLNPRSFSLGGRFGLGHSWLAAPLSPLLPRISLTLPYPHHTLTATLTNQA
ncbi:unnamed protein product [Pleuronectes platessa]|uniref:Uncharacterized protein n=1 Tax=Pleuronectes platessa TaxID=8262 RepID=A0A9N7YEW8_PLEPL|nr:unnamed protein product [Pleuronectes platessa]